MPSMTYCRHENTLADLEQVWELWEEWTAEGSNGYEQRARHRLIRLVREMHDQFELDGTYDELDEAEL
jgi:hypothetical protein